MTDKLSKGDLRKIHSILKKFFLGVNKSTSVGDCILSSYCVGTQCTLSVWYEGTRHIIAEYLKVHKGNPAQLIKNTKVYGHTYIGDVYIHTIENLLKFVSPELSAKEHIRPKGSDVACVTVFSESHDTGYCLPLGWNTLDDIKELFNE